MKPGVCLDGRCVNTEGSFHCQCQTGFTTNPEKTACLGTRTSTHTHTYTSECDCKDGRHESSLKAKPKLVDGSRRHCNRVEKQAIAWDPDLMCLKYSLQEKEVTFGG